MGTIIKVEREHRTSDDCCVFYEHNLLIGREVRERKSGKKFEKKIWPEMLSC